MNLLEYYKNRLFNTQKEIENLEKVLNNTKKKILENINLKDWVGNHLFQSLFIVMAYKYYESVLGENSEDSTRLSFDMQEIQRSAHEYFIEDPECQQRFYLIEMIGDMANFYDYYEVSQMNYNINVESNYIDAVCYYNMENLDNWEMMEYFMIHEDYEQFVNRIEQEIFNDLGVFKSIIDDNLAGKYKSFYYLVLQIAEQYPYKKTDKEPQEDEITILSKKIDEVTKDSKEVLNIYMDMIRKRKERVDGIVRNN